MRLARFGIPGNSRPELCRNRDRRHPLGSSLKTRNPLFSARYHFFFSIGFFPVLEQHRDLGLAQRAKAHANDHFIEGIQFSEILAVAVSGYQAKPRLKLLQNLRKMLLQKKFPALALPRKVTQEVNVSSQVRVFESNTAPMFVNRHNQSPHAGMGFSERTALSTTATLLFCSAANMATTNGVGLPVTVAEKVAMRLLPDRSSTKS